MGSKPTEKIMVICRWCDREESYFELRQNEHTGKWNIWDNNLGTFHSCDKNPQLKKEREEYEARKQLYKINKIPIFCYTCQKSFPRLEPCSHILADGFIPGKDNASFYADTRQAEEKRNLIKMKIKQQNEPKPLDPQRKLF